MKHTATAILVLALPFVSGCFEGGPRAKVRDFLQALERGDSKAMDATLNRDSRTLFGNAELTPRAIPHTIGSETVSGDRATVMVDVRDADSTLTVPFVCVREDGVWKVDLRETIVEVCAQQGRKAMLAFATLIQSASRALEQMAAEMKKMVDDGTVSRFIQRMDQAFR